MAQITITHNRMAIQGDLVIATIPKLLKESERGLSHCTDSYFFVDLSGVSAIDSAGVAFLDDLKEQAAAKKCELDFEKASPDVQKSIDTFSLKRIEQPEPQTGQSVFEKMGNWGVKSWHRFLKLLYLVADTFYFTFVGLVRKKGMRQGEFINQCIIIGMNAFPIVALISFLIGFILALQSAAQLRQFGASIYVADLVAISMTREMGPIMTAIVFAGRSGSAIASEIATMEVTEETDALKSMALNPVRFILVPKMYALTTMMPLLTILSTIIGILGALVIGVTYLDIGMKPFYDQVVKSLIVRDIWTGLIKSVVFAWIIGLVGAYQGFRVKGGAEGVGKATTASVVVSIFMVILADSILGLIFYFGEGISY
jgi:phospholipid/cholesterol/gamma-HCH transport system permease protein